LHNFGLWQVWTIDPRVDFVLLGDLSAYVSLSGYRFRLPAANSTTTTTDTGSNTGTDTATDNGTNVGESLVLVGVPGENVDVTYLRRSNALGGSGGRGSFTVMVQRVVIGAAGRSEVTLK
jgi:hypothetical protein